jgi:hypothetical protein
MENKIEKLEQARKEFRTAMIARDAIDDCCSPAWYSAHLSAGEACRKMNVAYEEAYDSGELHRPYWSFDATKIQKIPCLGAF